MMEPITAPKPRPVPIVRSRNTAENGALERCTAPVGYSASASKNDGRCDARLEFLFGLIKSLATSALFVVSFMVLSTGSFCCSVP